MSNNIPTFSITSSGNSFSYASLSDTTRQLNFVDEDEQVNPNIFQSMVICSLLPKIKIVKLEVGATHLPLSRRRKGIP